MHGVFGKTKIRNDSFMSDSTKKNCIHLFVAVYECSSNRPEFWVHYRCSKCAKYGDAFQLKISPDELDIKRNRSLDNLKYKLRNEQKNGGTHEKGTDQIPETTMD